MDQAAAVRITLMQKIESEEQKCTKNSGVSVLIMRMNDDSVTNVTIPH